MRTGRMGGRSPRRTARPWSLVFLTAALLGLTVGVQPALTAPPPDEPGATVDNGTVRLGVQNTGSLIFPSPVANQAGDQQVATGLDGLRAGCDCEGWGAGSADPGNFFTGYTTPFADFGPPVNVAVDRFVATKKTAMSETIINPDKLKVTHFFRPSPKTDFLYEAKVTLRNISDEDIRDLRYTRVMDWDVEPTPFQDEVTLIGSPARPRPLRYSNDNGFSSSNPFDVRAPLNVAANNTDFTDLGPQDHGALFDFGFEGDSLGPDGALRPGQSKKITIYYGNAPTETQALGAVQAVGAEVYSFGQSAGGAQTGAPATFIFGFEDDNGREGDSGPQDPASEQG